MARAKQSKKKPVAPTPPPPEPQPVLNPAVPWLGVRNWDQYQHYRNRQPPWIKSHVAILDDRGFARLSDTAQLTLWKLWLLASRQDGRIELDLEWIVRRIDRPRPTMATIVELVAGQWLLPLTPAASAMLAEASTTPQLPRASVMLAPDASTMLTSPFSQQRREEVNSSLREDEFAALSPSGVQSYLDDGAAPPQGGRSPAVVRAS
ncbi:MAG: hypothetical protein AB7G23_19330 [Vicinamibacterales bacterium]